MIARWGEYTHPEPVWKGIPGFFDYQAWYDRLAAWCKDGYTFVEVGSLLGRSACYLGEKLQAANVKSTILCVDEWPSSYVWGNAKDTTIESPFETFYANVRQSGLQKIIVPIRANSEWAASFIKGGLDSVFIDAAHDYDNVKLDIAVWLPKVRPGGIISGHDYDETVFPGVVQAVKEAFPSGVEICGRCWIVHL